MPVTAPASPAFTPSRNALGTTHVFTSESVSEGHPDKVSDFIADSILDAHLAIDSRSRVACEVLVKSGNVVLAGEITSTGAVDYDAVARQAIREIGFELAIAIREVGAMLINVGWEQTFATSERSTRPRADDLP